MASPTESPLMEIASVATSRTGEPPPVTPRACRQQQEDTPTGYTPEEHCMQISTDDGIGSAQAAPVSTDIALAQIQCPMSPPGTALFSMMLYDFYFVPNH